ncbi:MAG TPA: helix-turn-helix domain-containing protein [Solirubrobacteraceae bacterium]|nr:helix-turn-helix domain-containing protein [Solirubrobacteraceae bacterium]
MAVREDEARAPRRRRTPEAAQKEIIDAAQALLRERPFRELTVDEVMRRTGLSRPSFYVYFRDRHDLVLRVVQDLGAEMLEVANRWYEATGEGPALLRDALEGAVGVYCDHAAVLRALADAAADDPDVERAYDGMQQGFIDATAQHIQGEIDAGRILPLDARETAKALIWMIERYLYHAFAPEQRVPAERVIETLQTVMVRTLYGARSS